MLDLVGNPEDRFSRVAAQIVFDHLTFSMLSNIVKSIWQPTDVFSNFFPCFLNF